MDSLSLSLAGEEVALLPDRGLYWRPRRTLFIADLHYGNASSLRTAGIPIPGQVGEDDLGRLGLLVDGLRAERLVVLGDFLHARRGHDAQTRDALRAWREDFQSLTVQIVPGSHDREVAELPSDLRFDLLPEPAIDAPFVLSHRPEPSADGYVLAGHMHPAVRQDAAVHDRVRLPCFVIGEQVAVLPAFGTAVGMALVTRQPGERIYAIDGERISALPVT